jgi:O-antigen/teichoic acid export membrane protein
MSADELAAQQHLHTARRLISGTAVKYLLLAINIATGIVLLPFTIAHLGKELYGLWMVVASMTAYFQLLDLGFGHSLVRHITEADGQRNERRINELASTFVVIFAALGSVVLGGTALMAFFVLPRYPNIRAEHVAIAQPVMLILGTRLAVSLPMSVFGAVATSRQAFARNGITAIIVTLLQTVATVVVLSSGYGLVTLVASTTAIALLSYVVYAHTAYQVLPSLRIRPLRNFRRERLRELATFGVYVFVINIAVQVGFNLDHLVVGAWLGTAAVAVYAVSFRLADYQRQLCNQFNGLLFPVLVKYGAAGDTASLRTTVTESTRLAFGLVAGVTVTLLLLGDTLIQAWVGPGFEGGVWPLYALALAGVVLVSQQPLGSLLMGTGHHRLVAAACVAESTANVALSILLVQRYGLFGVALGTMIPVVAVNLAWLMPAACRSVGLRYGRFLLDVVRPAVLPIVVTAGAGAWFRTVWIPDGLGSVLLQAVMLGTIYSVTFLAMLPRAFRERYLRAVFPSRRQSRDAGTESSFVTRAGAPLESEPPVESPAGVAAPTDDVIRGLRPTS